MNSNTNEALILVDLQCDFLPSGALPVPNGDQVIPIANRLMPRFNLVVASRDWHPPNHCSFADNHPGRGPGETVRVAGLDQILWPTHCVMNTTGAEFAPQLDLARIDRVINKGTDPQADSYSGFFDNARRHDTGLHAFLREQNIEQLVIMGLATNVCVVATVVDACELGYRTRVAIDGCRGVELNPGDVAHAEERMRAVGAEIIDSAAICAA